MAWHGVEGKARQVGTFPHPHTQSSPAQPSPGHLLLTHSHSSSAIPSSTSPSLSFSPSNDIANLPPSTLTRSSLERRICFSHASSPNRKFLAFPSFPSPVFEP
ncbi:hypothetical protein FOXYSP1_03415 [Fusarium oxysporum f. sp. phaseoli]